MDVAWSGLGSALAEVETLCFYTVSLSTRVYEQVPANLMQGGVVVNPTMD